MADEREEEMAARVGRLMPPWFGAAGDAPPVLGMVLAMPGRVAVQIEALTDFARRQTRIATAEGGWLDLIAFDFFGRRVRRGQGQSDVGLRARIIAELFRPRGTREAMRRMLRDLTGREPDIFEPLRPGDTGGIGRPGQMGIGVAGRIGSSVGKGQAFVTARRTPESGIPLIAGIGSAQSGIGEVGSSFAIASLTQIRGALTDADIIGAVEAVRPAGIVVWMRIEG